MCWEEVVLYLVLVQCFSNCNSVFLPWLYKGLKEMCDIAILIKSEINEWVINSLCFVLNYTSWRFCVRSHWELLICGLLADIFYAMFKCMENLVMSETRTIFCSVVEDFVSDLCTDSKYVVFLLTYFMLCSSVWKI